MTKNPQANAICEHLHQTIGNVLCTQQHLTLPQMVQEANQLIENILAMASYAAQTAIHSTMKTMPGALVFHRDMLLNIPIIADLQLMQQRHQALINHNLMIANWRCISHDYQINDQVLILTYKPNKLEPRAIGPFRVNRVHTNGTITIQRFPHVEE